MIKNRSPRVLVCAALASFVLALGPAMAAGAANVPIHYVQVLTQPLGSVALDDVYGVLGVDVLDQLRSYTFDYKNMRFRVESE